MAEKSKSEDVPLDAPPEVWAEIDAVLDREAGEWKKEIKGLLEKFPPDADDEMPPVVKP